jgi:hypothetical protein
MGWGLQSFLLSFLSLSSSSTSYERIIAKRRE